MSSLADVTVYQGADVASDHHTLVTSVNIKLKASRKTDDVNTHMTYNVAQLTSTDLRFDLEVE